MKRKRYNEKKKSINSLSLKKFLISINLLFYFFYQTFWELRGKKKYLKFWIFKIEYKIKRQYEGYNKIL